MFQVGNFQREFVRLDAEFLKRGGDQLHSDQIQRRVDRGSDQERAELPAKGIEGEE